MHIYVITCICTYRCAYIHIAVSSFCDSSFDAYMYINTYVYVCTYVHVPKYINTWKYTYILIYTYKQFLTYGYIQTYVGGLLDPCIYLNT